MGQATPSLEALQNQAAVAEIAKVRQANINTLLRTTWEWFPLSNSKSGNQTPAYALNTDYAFYLKDMSGFIDKFRIWVYQLDLNVNLGTTTGAAVDLNAAGIWTILGNLRVELGGHLYRVQSGFIPLLAATFKRLNHPWGYPGYQVQPYSAALYGTTNGSTTSTGVLTNNGDNIFTGYLDIPMAMMEQVHDPDGIAPTLANAGFKVSFTTPNQLAGQDALLYPFYEVNGATIALGTATTSQISVWAHVATQQSPMGPSKLNPFVVGPAFVVDVTSYPLENNREQFYAFQGQAANLVLLKSIMVIDNPGEVAGQFANSLNIAECNLMFDGKTSLAKSGPANNPFGIANLLVDQREAIGDQPDGVVVFDFQRGTDPEYPNGIQFLNLKDFQYAGVQLQYTGALNAAATVFFCNVYLDASKYVGQ